MQPQFQSSFIPKGPVSSGPSLSGMNMPRRRQTDLFSLVASSLFILSLVLACGAFLYQLFLNYNISQMKGELESARAALEPETVNTLIRLNSRLVSTEALIKNHQIITPVFDFLEVSTPKTVRYTDFNFNTTTKGLELTIQGQAVSYAALAVAAETFDKAVTYFANTVFSDLRLDDKGNVIFTLRTQVQPAALSYYERTVNIVEAPVISVPKATTTATSTP